MANNKLERTFDFLQKHLHYTDEDYVNHPEFKKIADFKIKHTEYWLFSDLYNLFGPQYVGTHERIIEKQVYWAPQKRLLFMYFFLTMLCQ